jgi:hypothetical protein
MLTSSPCMVETENKKMTESKVVGEQRASSLERTDVSNLMLAIQV